MDPPEAAGKSGRGAQGAPRRRVDERSTCTGNCWKRACASADTDVRAAVCCATSGRRGEAGDGEVRRVRLDDERKEGLRMIDRGVAECHYQPMVPADSLRLTSGGWMVSRGVSCVPEQ